MTKDLKKKEETTLAVNESFGGVASGIDVTDITIPNINIGQAISEAVKAKDAEIGDLYDSVSRSVLAKKGEALEAIFLKVEKVLFVTSGKKGNNFERIEPFTPGYAYEEEINGVTLQRSLMYRYFVLLPKDIKDGIPFPYVVSFMKSNMSVAKKVNSMFQRMIMMNKKSFDIVMEVSTVEKSSDNGTFSGFDVKQGRETTADEKKVIGEMASQFAASNIKIHEPKEADKEKEKELDEIPF